MGLFSGLKKTVKSIAKPKSLLKAFATGGTSLSTSLASKAGNSAVEFGVNTLLGKPPAAPTALLNVGNDQATQDQKKQVDAAKDEASRRASRATQGSGFQQTLLSGFAPGASGDQIRRKTLLGQ